ncbi:MAG: RNA polymerase sigma factor [Acidimicrobiia bacterium]
MSQPAEMRFKHLFESHHRAIQQYCFRRLPSSDANDAVAEVFVVAWRKIDDAPEGDRALPWLYGISRNVVRNAHRSTRRSTELRRKLAGVATDDNPGPETQVVRSAEHSEALEALATLRPEDQEIIRLRTWEELSNEEIASVMGLSVRAVESRLTRARRKLEKILSTSGAPLTQARPLPAENGGER